MATSAQVAANQANAKLSTGPRTAAGKDITRKNASRHGLCSTLPGVCIGDQRGETLLADLKDEHHPQGPTEEILVYKMAEQFILSTRAAQCLDAESVIESSNAQLVALFLRYYTTADRAFTRNLNELRKLQKERKQQEAEAAIGSVSQNPETAPAPPPATAEPATSPAPKPAPEPESSPVEPISAATEVNQATDGPSASQKQAA